MKKRLFILLQICIIQMIVINVFAQSEKVKAADKLFNDFAYIDAIKKYEEIIKDGEMNAYICRQLAESYRRIGNSEQSEYWYKMVIDSGTNDQIVYYYYSEALKSNKKYKEAEIWIKKFSSFSLQDSRMKREVEAQYKEKIYFADSNNVSVMKLKINTSYLDFSPCYYKDKIVFSSARDTNQNARYVWDKQPFIKLYFSDKYPDMQLYNVNLFSNELNSKYHEGPCTFNEIGNIIYFTRNNLKESRKVVKSKDKTNNLKIYSSFLIGGKWTNIKEFKYNSDEYSTGHPSLSKDGNTLYFASDRPGTYGQADIWYCKKINGEWSDPVNLGQNINTEGNEMFPYFANDGTLYFASDGHPGFGGLDIYSAIQINDTTWRVVNMGYPLNSPKDDFGLIVDDNIESGYFSSNRIGGNGSDDIYAFKVKNPDLLISEIIGKKNPKNILTESKNKQNQDTVKTKIDDDKNSVMFEGKKVKIGEPIALPCIYYDYDKYNIRPDAAEELNKIIRFMFQYPNAIIELSSHTDCRGPFQYNMDLSQNRAQAAVDYISKIGGVKKERLIAKGYGKTRHVNKCSDGIPCSEIEHQNNRRTEFTILRIN